jgi:membrane-bound ClpP family serine protease
MESSYLAIAFLLIGIGVAMIGAEFFFPTGGFLLVGGALLFAASVGIIWYYGKTTEAVVATIGMCVGLPAAGVGLFHTWKRFALKSGLDPDEAGGSITNAVPELAGLDKLKGRFGKTATPMRPAGSVVIDGKRVDALSEGMMIDAGVWVRCVDVKAGHVVVRQAQAPNDLQDMEFDDIHQ